MAAGGIIEEIRALGKKPKLSECAFVLDQFYRTHKNKLSELIKRSKTYQRLTALGETADIEHALQSNLYDFVPFLYDNWMTADSNSKGE